MFLEKLPCLVREGTFSLIRSNLLVTQMGKLRPEWGQELHKVPYKLQAGHTLFSGATVLPPEGEGLTLSGISQLLVVKKRSFMTLVRNTSPSFGCQGAAASP